MAIDYNVDLVSYLMFRYDSNSLTYGFFEEKVNLLSHGQVYSRDDSFVKIKNACASQRDFSTNYTAKTDYR